LLSPTGLIWILGHIIILLVGIIFVAFSGYSGVSTLVASIMQGVGGSLIATGIAGEALFVYIRANDRTRERLEFIFASGLSKVFPTRSVSIKREYDERLRGAKKIDILGFGLSSLREDYGPEFAGWSRSAEVRIILLDPEFPSREHSYADQRDRDEQSGVGKIRRDVEAFIEQIKAAEGLDRNRFKIRLLRTLPSINMFRIDDQIFWGPYFALQQSRNTPTFLIERGFLHERLREHFETLWSSDQFSSEVSATSIDSA
jgi:hypothetical protein